MASTRTESARRNSIKAHGVHYTPPELSRFLANHVLALLPAHEPTIILDPACGAGELLAAIAAEVDPTQRERLTLVGIDRDQTAVAAATERLADLRPARIRVDQADFLAGGRPNGVKQASFFELAPAVRATTQQYDAIISNPPYVRTQVLGAATAQKLAAEYELSGRVDLYHAFVRAMTDHLKDGGILGLLCSNRFLTTKGGMALRELLWREYELCDVFDLGDTKLFAAAVLPAIIIARKRTGVAVQRCAFVRTYERHGADPVARHPSVLAAIDAGDEGVIGVNGSAYEIERGTLKTLGRSGEPWTLTSSSVEGWLKTVDRNTEATFADVARIRVGIKTTADPVFISSDWESLPEERRPEPNLLRPLLTHHLAERWAIDPQTVTRRVLYPHEVVNGRRTAIPLDRFPRTRAYLESHRHRLTARSYVRASGRQWYEIWVPQNPADWAKPKIVFPDISEAPRFFLDTSGAVVNGDCYWFTIDGHLDRAHLMLAVANSTFAVRFYDAVCANRLYAGRRRFITQYVNRFPLPRVSVEDSRSIRTTVEQLINLPPGSDERAVLETALDRMVWKAFGLPKEAGR